MKIRTSRDVLLGGGGGWVGVGGGGGVISAPVSECLNDCVCALNL